MDYEFGGFTKGDLHLVEKGSLHSMKQYQAKNILNVAIAGHSGSGKTTVAEAMLYLSGASDRLGRVTEGNTICDYDPEEI